jgi:cytochrome c5
MKKITLPLLAGLVFIVQVSFADEAIDAKFEKSCKMCHATGLLNAPKVGDAAAWAPRLAQGKDVLFKHAKEGFNQMPPKGTCMDCTDEDLQKLIEKLSQ